MEQLSRTEMSMKEIERALDDVGKGIANLFECFSQQPLDGPLNYWSIYRLKQDLLTTRQNYDVVKRSYQS